MRALKPGRPLGGRGWLAYLLPILAATIALLIVGRPAP